MPNPRSPRVRAVPAVTRAIAILRLLSRSRDPQSLKAIAESLDLVPSTALHIARALNVQRGARHEIETLGNRLEALRVAAAAEQSKDGDGAGDGGDRAD